MVGFRCLPVTSTRAWHISAFNGAITRAGSVSRTRYPDRRRQPRFQPWQPDGLLSLNTDTRSIQRLGRGSLQLGVRIPF